MTEEPTLVERLRAEGSALSIEAADDIEANDQSLDLRWNADMRAIKRWQAAHPGKKNIWPDHADLVVWLLEQLGESDEKIEEAGRQETSADADQPDEASQT